MSLPYKTAFWVEIGKAIEITGRIENLIDLLIAFHYCGDMEQNTNFIKDVLRQNYISLDKKIEIFLKKVMGSKIKFSNISNRDLREKFPQFRNQLAHCQLATSLDEEIANKKSLPVALEAISRYCNGEFEYRFRTRRGYLTLGYVEDGIRLGEKILTDMTEIFNKYFSSNASKMVKNTEQKKPQLVSKLLS